MNLDNIWDVKKLNAKPVKVISLIDNSMSMGMGGARGHTLKDSSGLPPPTKQQLDMFSKNHIVMAPNYRNFLIYEWS